MIGISAAAERIAHFSLPQEAGQQVSVEEVQTAGLSRPNATILENHREKKESPLKSLLPAEY